MYSYHNPNHYYEHYRQADDKLARDIEKAINLKYNTINCYAQLTKQAPNNITKVNINAIRDDDIKHYQQFLQIYKILTGKTLEAKIIQVCAKTFEEGVEGAFINEQVDSRFYLQISDGTTNQTVKNVFYRAYAEDQIHANWFLYYMIKYKK